jgi:hypothetical protein
VNPYPEPWELIAIFEREPSLADPTGPWFYTRAQYSLARGPERLEFVAVPADQEVDLTYTVGDRVVVALALRRVSGLSIYRERDTEGMTVLMQDESRGDLRIQTAPDIRLTWRENPD